MTGSQPQVEQLQQRFAVDVLHLAHPAQALTLIERGVTRTRPMSTPLNPSASTPPLTNRRTSRVFTTPLSTISTRRRLSSLVARNPSMVSSRDAQMGVQVGNLLAAAVNDDHCLLGQQSRHRCHESGEERLIFHLVAADFEDENGFVGCAHVYSIGYGRVGVAECGSLGDRYAGRVNILPHPHTPPLTHSHQPRRFRYPKHHIHILHRLSRRALDQVVDARSDDQRVCARHESQADGAEIRVSRVRRTWRPDLWAASRRTARPHTSPRTLPAPMSQTHLPAVSRRSSTASPG